jgi:hypothetical protein
MKMYKTCIMLICIAAVTLMTGCAGSGPLSGSGSQSTNSVTVSVSADSVTVTARRDLKVMVFAADYRPYRDSLYADTAVMSDGKCTISSLAGGNYTVLMTDTSQGLSAILQQVPVGSGSAVSLVYAGTLDTGGSISGIIRQNGRPAARATAYIQGTPFITVADDSGGYRFSSIPFSAYRVIAKPADTIPASAVDTSTERLDSILAATDTGGVLIVKTISIIGAPSGRQVSLLTAIPHPLLLDGVEITPENPNGVFDVDLTVFIQPEETGDAGNEAYVSNENGLRLYKRIAVPAAAETVSSRSGTIK